MSAWPNLASPRREVSVNSCTDQVSLWPYLCLIGCGNLCGKPPSTVSISFAYAGNPELCSTENKQSTENHAFLLSLLLGVDVTTGFQLQPPCYDGLWPRA